MLLIIFAFMMLPLTFFHGNKPKHKATIELNSSVKRNELKKIRGISKKCSWMKPDPSIYHKGWIDLNKNGKMDPYENPKLPIEERITNLLSQMTLNEKIAQMVTLYGYARVLPDSLPTPEWLHEPWRYGIANIDEDLNDLAYHPRAHTSLAWPPAVHAKAINEVQRFFIEKTRLGIPVDFTNEGICGVNSEMATGFPAEIGQGSMWDPKLIHEIGEVEGREARALGYTNIYSPELDVTRDPRWGRTVSTYGEDPFLISKYGVAMVTGLQKEGVASTLKHFAVYCVPEGGRDGDNRTDPHVTPREVKTILLPPFKAAVKAGALGVMSSYNYYNGIPMTGNYHYLTQILRRNWGFKGYIVTDSGALQFIYSKYHVQPSFSGAIKQAVEAGVNVRTDFERPSVYLNPLRKLVEEGKIPMSVINQRVRQVLYVKFKLGLFDHPYVSVKAANHLVRTPSSMALSLRASEESLVLLKNKNNLLPLDKHKIHSILVTGPDANATDYAIRRYGPSNVPVITTLEGIKKAVGPHVKVRYVKGPSVTGDDWPESDIMQTPISTKGKEEIAEAVRAAKHSDVAIVVVGDSRKTVGESRSRVSLKLPGHQLALIKAIYKTGTPTVVVLINGRPLSIDWTNAHVPSILEAWFPGEKGGEAIAKALFGSYDPGGKLSITFPKYVGQVPLNFPFMPASESYFNERPARARVTGPLYPFGYGLSYTKFKFSNLKITPLEQHTGGDIHVSLDVKNTGKRQGDEVVQLYLHERTTPVVVPVEELRGFKRISLEPGQTKRVDFTLTPKDFQLLNKYMKWQVVPGTFDVGIGSSSVDLRLKSSFKIIS